MKTIYIVIGTTGQWSDKSEWLVKAFNSKEKAEQFKEECNDFAKSVEKFEADNEDIRYGDYREWKRLEQKLYSKSPDSRFQRDYTGTWYMIDEVELVEGE